MPKETGDTTRGDITTQRTGNVFFCYSICALHD